MGSGVESSIGQNHRDKTNQTILLTQHTPIMAHFVQLKLVEFGRLRSAGHHRDRLSGKAHSLIGPLELRVAASPDSVC